MAGTLDVPVAGAESDESADEEGETSNHRAPTIKRQSQILLLSQDQSEMETADFVFLSCALLVQGRRWLAETSASSRQRSGWVDHALRS